MSVSNIQKALSNHNGHMRKGRFVGVNGRIGGLNVNTGTGSAFFGVVKNGIAPAVVAAAVQANFIGFQGTMTVKSQQDGFVIFAGLGKCRVLELDIAHAMMLRFADTIGNPEFEFAFHVIPIENTAWNRFFCTSIRLPVPVSRCWRKLTEFKLSVLAVLAM